MGVGEHLPEQAIGADERSDERRERVVDDQEMIADRVEGVGTR